MKTRSSMIEQLDVNTALLEPLETAAVPATKKPVIVRDWFTTNASVRISTIFSEFRHRFFDKTEGPITKEAYAKYKLLGISNDGPIIAELGGEDKVEGKVTAALAFLRSQSTGESGFLQTNGYANIFYAKDKKGELCAIRIGWADDGWVVDAISVNDPQAWHGEHLIFCPL
jgi:hypothetical protein